MKLVVGMALYSAIFFFFFNRLFEGKKSFSVILFSAFYRLFSTFIQPSCGFSLFFVLAGGFLSSKPMDWYHLSGKGQSRSLELNG